MGQSIISSSSYDYKPYRSVPVIASFNPDGKIKPLYVQVEGSPRKVHSYWVRYRFANQIEFFCKLEIDGILQPLLLTYYINECMWILQPFL